VADFFLLETHSQPKTPKNHPNNLFKPILSLQKHKKPVKNPKSTRKPISFLSQNWFFRNFQGKKTLKSNFPHHMEPLGIKI
jgi:hypothetical protein